MWASAWSSFPREIKGVIRLSTCEAKCLRALLLMYTLARVIILFVFFFSPHFFSRDAGCQEPKGVHDDEEGGVWGTAV
ncbi:hypothetical protein BDZ91DRAFT_727893 [Kalaharituber pfeilii]|nr:hypothetical protein BDZ91DRAFT_727893 [Kalaharituber pfeilii]